MRRNRSVLVLAAGVAAATLVACGGPDEAGPGGEAGTLRVLLATQPPALDPITGGRSAGQMVWGTMLEPVITLDEDLEPTADGIVTAWERTDDTTWTLTVREGIEFSNGEAADAAAVARTIELTRDTQASQLKQYFDVVAETETPDDATVVVRTTTPQYNLPYLLTAVFLVPPAYYDEVGPEGFSSAPIGTGPYVLDEIRAGRDIAVDRNPDYWGDAATTERIVFTWAAEPAQRLALLRSGDADVVLDLPRTQADEAEDAGLTVERIETAMTVVAFLQGDRAPLDDPRLREAVALAVDRDQIVDGLLGEGAVSQAGMLNVRPGEEPVDSVTADPGRARELVGDAEVSVPIRYPVGQYPEIEEVAQAMAASLEDAGFGVSLEPLDYGSLAGQIIGREVDGIYLLGSLANAPVPDYTASGFLKSTALTGNCPDPRIDGLIAEALAQEDAAASQPIYDELNTLAVVENHCYVPLYRLVVAVATASGVEGVEYTPLNTVDFTGASRG